MPMLITAVRKLQASGLARTLSWALGAALILQFLNVVNSVLLGRILQAEQFGQYNLILTTVAIAGSIGSFGMGVTATRFVASERGHGGAKLGSLLRFMLLFTGVASSAAALVFLLASSFIADALVGQPALSRAYRLSSLYVLGASLDLVLLGILMGFEQFRLLTFAAFFKGVTTIALCTLLSRASGLEGAVLGIGLSSNFSMLLDGWLVWRMLKTLPATRESLSGAEKQQLLKFSLPIMLASLLVNPSVWLSSVMVSQVPGGSRLLGEFAVVRNWMTILQFFPIQIAQALLPFMSRRAVTSVQSARARFLPLLLVTAVAAGLALVTYPIGVWFIHLYGFRSPSLHVALSLVVAGSVFSAVNTMSGQMLLSEGYAWPRLAVDVLIACVLVIMVSLFIHKLGQPELALAAATTLSLAAGALGIVVAQLSLHRHRRRYVPES